MSIKGIRGINVQYKIREKIFSFSDDFTIKDMEDNDIFIVKGKVFSIGDKLKLLDMQGNELVYIEQEPFRLLAKYNIYLNGNHAAVVKRKFSLVPKFIIESSMGNYTIDGNIFGFNFTIYKDGRNVATVSKKILAFSDSYVVDIVDNENHPFILAFVIIIDQVIHEKDK
jgi:uncharacterized protein YxjI